MADREPGDRGTQELDYAAAQHGRAQTGNPTTAKRERGCIARFTTEVSTCATSTPRQSVVRTSAGRGAMADAQSRAA